jgi:hypothetical protein
MNHNITDLGIPAESELRGIGIISIFMNANAKKNALHVNILSLHFDWLNIKDLQSLR